MPTDNEKNQRMFWTWAGWEPEQFYRRLGGFHEQQEGNALWMPEWFETVHSQRAARALAEAGINWVTTHFFKGFGLESEADEIEKTKEMVENYHREGVAVFAYIQYGTLVPETMEEVWGRCDEYGRHNGHPYEYGDQYWRRKPCANQEGFREYLREVVAKAVEIGADGIWVDNLQADGCHCDDCQVAFRKYLEKHVEDPWKELGLHDVSRVQIPRAERPRDPVFQYWVWFRCKESAASLQLLADKARSLKPDIVFCVNVGIGSPQRHVLENGIALASLSVADYTYAENPLRPRWEAGRIFTQHFPAKVAEYLGVRIVPGAGVPRKRVGLYSRPGIPDEIMLRRVYAESALFGDHAFGGPWGMRGEDGGEDPAWLRDKEFRENNRLLADFYQNLNIGEDASEIGLLYSLEAMGWDEARSKKAFQEMEQLLLQHQFPFRYLLSERMEFPESLKLLILPHVLPMSDDLADQLRQFVANGGRVLATGRTSLYDERMRQRGDYALADVFGVHFSSSFEEVHLNHLFQNESTGCMFLPGEWALDENLPFRNERLIEAVADVVRSPVCCPLPHVVCTQRRLSDGKYLIGLINYADIPVHGITLSKVPEGETIVWSVKRAAEELQGAELPPLETELFVTTDLR